MLKNYNKSVAILFSIFIFFSLPGNGLLQGKWRVGGDTMGDGVPVFIAITESKDKSLVFEISYNTDESFPDIDITSTGAKFKMRFDNKPDKAIIIFSSSKEYQFDAFPSNELGYFLNMNKKELDALISDFKKEKQFTLSIISEDNKNIIIDKKKWYKPLTKTVNLSDIEKKNVDLIKSAEN